MITAASAALSCPTEREFLTSALTALAKLLDVSCCVFYSATPTLNHIGSVRVNHGAGAELRIPESLPLSFSDHVRRQSGRTIISQDWDALATLLPSFDFSLSSSLWISIGIDSPLGTMALFDHPSRRFDRTQQKLAESFASVVATGLLAQAKRYTQRAESATYDEFSTLVGSVARDLINPMSAVFGYMELLKAETLEMRPAHLVTRMEQQIEKARRMLATFSKESPLAKVRPAEISAPVPRSELEKPIAQLPRKQERAQEPWRPPQPDSGQTARILLVQRSEAVFEFERSVLSALGAEVIPAFSATDALDQLRGRELDAIILDDELEEPSSSKQLVMWVRENRPELSDRMLLTVSRKPTPQTREILESAMLPHVTKPLEVLELYSRAQQVLQAGRSPHLLQ